MIPSFEDYTARVGEKTKEFLKPILKDMLLNALGQENAITAFEISQEILKKRKVYNSPNTILKVITDMRYNNDMAPKLICASQYGCFLAKDAKETKKYADCKHAIAKATARNAKLASYMNQEMELQEKSK